jgi:hypothetical protein
MAHPHAYGAPPHAHYPAGPAYLHHPLAPLAQQYAMQPLGGGRLVGGGGGGPLPFAKYHLTRITTSEPARRGWAGRRRQPAGAPAPRSVCPPPAAQTTAPARAPAGPSHPAPPDVVHVLFYGVDAAGDARLAVVGTDVRQTGHFVYAVRRQGGCRAAGRRRAGAAAAGAALVGRGPAGPRRQQATSARFPPSTPANARAAPQTVADFDLGPPLRCTNRAVGAVYRRQEVGSPRSEQAPAAAPAAGAVPAAPWLVLHPPFA